MSKKLVFNEILSHLKLKEFSLLLQMWCSTVINLWCKLILVNKWNLWNPLHNYPLQPGSWFMLGWALCIVHMGALQKECGCSDDWELPNEAWTKGGPFHGVRDPSTSCCSC